ncbi:MAG TPA: DHA2 family efflux MFS transporter permease subunit [Bacillota bacterium]|nr:DHA2 family efflux MFS transporter permease subunit [Bacillota bacterium]
MDIKKLHENPPYGIIAVLFIGGFVSFLNNTLLNIAIPTIMEEFSVAPSAVQWVTTGYMLINGILIPTSAFFIQRFTNRQVFLTAMSLFALGTFLALIAPSFLVIVIARMTQASGAAMMMPLLMNVMLTAFPVEKRGAAMGFFGMVMFMAPAIGPPLSGWVIEQYSWRALFLIILPFAIITILFAIFKLKNITPQRHVELDKFSLVLSSVGFGGLLYGFSSAGENGWSAADVYGTIIIGSLALLMFVLRQIRLNDPMLDFEVFKFPMFALASIISVVMSVSMFSGMILTPLYVQTVREISPFYSGILMLPGAIVMGLMSPITGRLFDRYGARGISLTGLTITIATTYLLSRLTLDLSYFYLMTLYTVRMFGMSMVMMPIMTNGLNQLPMRLNPHGTAMNGTLQQVSGAIGSAVLLTIMTKRTESVMMEQLANVQATAGMNEKQLLDMAMLDGINFSFFISTLIAILAFVLTFFVKRVTPPPIPKMDKVDSDYEVEPAPSE